MYAASSRHYPSISRMMTWLRVDESKWGSEFFETLMIEWAE